jgi:tellurite methyltransferase
VAAGDRERWDAKFRAGSHASDSPPAWLAAFDSALPRAGRALDVAAGAGRVARFWAARGLATTAADVSPVALELARAAVARDGHRLELLALDLERESLPEGPFAAISCFHYLQRDLFPRLVERLAPGGVLACEIATVRNLERHASPGRRFLLEPGELLELCLPLEILSHSEGWEGDSFLARAVARRA